MRQSVDLKLAAEIVLLHIQRIFHLHAKAEMLCGEIVCLDVGFPNQLIEKYAEIQKVA